MLAQPLNVGLLSRTGHSLMTGYRAFPSFPNPRSARRPLPEEFELLNKTQMAQSPSICKGHRGSTVWHVKQEKGTCYVLQVDLEDRPSVLVETVCTFTPTFGIDAVDGMLIEDAEHLILNEALGFGTKRLDIYGSEPQVNPTTYLASRGVKFNKVDGKKWWQFWR